MGQIAGEDAQIGIAMMGVDIGDGRPQPRGWIEREQTLTLGHQMAIGDLKDLAHGPIL